LLETTTDATDAAAAAAVVAMGENLKGNQRVLL